MLTEALRRFRHCPLTDDYLGLIIDGAWYRFRQLYGPERVVLAVVGIKADGTVVLLGLHVARSESAMEVARVLRDLRQRGLRGGSLQIVVADGAGGIEAAASEVYPWAQFQRCCWHHLQTLKHNASSAMTGQRMMKEAARCYHGHDLRKIQQRLHFFLAWWKDQQPKAVRLFQAHLDQTLTYLQPPGHMHRW
ncbi:MAG: transposase, partial [Kiritimatiellia bacterium]